MYMYKHVIKHIRIIKYICYLGLCNINKQFFFKYIYQWIIRKTYGILRLKIYQKHNSLKMKLFKMKSWDCVACWEGPWQCMLGDCHGYFYRMIWFLQLPAKDLSGNTMAFSSITSEGTWTLLPMKSKTTGAWTKS